jgi:hypothetical protein
MMLYFSTIFYNMCAIHVQYMHAHIHTRKSRHFNYGSFRSIQPGDNPSRVIHPPSLLTDLDVEPLPPKHFIHFIRNLSGWHVVSYESFLCKELPASAMVTAEYVSFFVYCNSFIESGHSRGGRNSGTELVW